MFYKIKNFLQYTSKGEKSKMVILLPPPIKYQLVGSALLHVMPTTIGISTHYCYWTPFGIFMINKHILYKT